MKTPNVNRGNQYARDVMDDKIPACKWIKLACKYHLAELEKSKSKRHPFYFDRSAAERALEFKQLFPHAKGKWAKTGETILLQPWQCFFWANVFGWKVRKTKRRRYRRALLFVPRKNGKSLDAATTGLYMLAADGEHGAEIYSGATTEEQAWQVFRPAKILAAAVPDFVDHFGVGVNASNINIVDTNSRFEAVIGNPGDGGSPSCAIIDEYHEHDNDDLFDTMETGMLAREQPLLVVITTAGVNLAGPCYLLQLDLQKSLEGVIEQTDTFGMIYTIDKDDDWKDINSLKKANPNFGVSVDADILLSRLQTAIGNARKQAVFKTKHLNVWVGARNVFFNIERWNQSCNKLLHPNLFEENRCWIGLDLSSKVDIAALRIVFELGENRYASFGKYYLPEAAIENGVNDHYAGWMRDGWLTITDGEIIDFNVIKEDIIDLCTVFDVEEVCYDPFQATKLVTELMDEGIPVVEIRPTVLNFSEPMKEMDGLIRSKKILHNGDPVYTWMLSNTVAKVDAKDNVYPRKERAENKIDGVISEIMVFNRILSEDPDNLDDILDDPLRADL